MWGSKLTLATLVFITWPASWYVLACPFVPFSLTLSLLQTHFSAWHTHKHTHCSPTCSMANFQYSTTECLESAEIFIFVIFYFIFYSCHNWMFQRTAHCVYVCVCVYVLGKGRILVSKKEKSWPLLCCCHCKKNRELVKKVTLYPITVIYHVVSEVNKIRFYLHYTLSCLLSVKLFIE